MTIVMNKYWIASSLIFLVGIVLGYGYSESFDAFIQSQIDGLRELARMIEDKPNTKLYLFGVIFLNNTFKSILMVFAGALFAFIPVFFLVINGMILGYLAENQVQSEQLGLLLKGILPHGIIEIPAIVIASAFGIRFGAILFKGLLSILSPRGRAASKAEVLQFMRITPALCLGLVVSLLVAAIIESTITPWVMGL
jgi:stage II sporulation protein M